MTSAPFLQPNFHFPQLLDHCAAPVSSSLAVHRPPPAVAPVAGGSRNAGARGHKETRQRSVPGGRAAQWGQDATHRHPCGCHMRETCHPCKLE